MRTKLFNFVGYIPYSSSNEGGFVLPIFSAPDVKGFFIQGPDIRSVAISEFVSIDDFSHEEIKSAPFNLSAAAGDKLIFGFQDDVDAIFVGNLDSLRSTLRSYLATSTNISANLQIAELLGTSEEKKNFRSKMVSAVELSLGEKASDNFSFSSVFLNALWDQLLSDVEDNIKLQVLNSQKKSILLGANANLDGIFSLDLQVWLRDEIGIDSYDIAHRLGSELPFRICGDKTSDVKSVDILQARVNKELREIYEEPRQEARVARLIRRIMENPGIGRHLIKLYHDKARFAQDAINLISNNINNFELVPDDDFISWLVDNLYTRSYPRQRGVLLYELAFRLGEFPAFAEAIRNHTHSSNAEAVKLAIDAIEERLKNPDAPRRSVTPIRQDYARGYSYVRDTPRPAPKTLL